MRNLAISLSWVGSTSDRCRGDGWGDLGLRAPTLPGAWPVIMGPHADGYGAAEIGGVGRSTDYATQNPSWVWAFGEIVLTTMDLDIFIASQPDGRLLSPPLDQMRAFRVEDADADYGLGQAGCFGLGHVGAVPGYDTFMFAMDGGGRRLEGFSGSGFYQGLPTTPPVGDPASGPPDRIVQSLLGGRCCVKSREIYSLPVLFDPRAVAQAYAQYSNILSHLGSPARFPRRAVRITWWPAASGSRKLACFADLYAPVADARERGRSPARTPT